MNEMDFDFVMCIFDGIGDRLKRDVAWSGECSKGD